MREGLSRRTLLAGLGTALGAALGAGAGRVFAHLDDPIPESIPNAVAEVEVPQAWWITDDGYPSVSWGNKILSTEELARIVPVPEPAPMYISLYSDEPPATDKFTTGQTRLSTIPAPQAEWPENVTWIGAPPSTPSAVELGDMKSLPAPIPTHQLTPAIPEAGILTEVWQEVDDDFLAQVNWPESSYISMEEDLALDGIWTEWVLLNGDIAKVFTPMSLNEPSYRVYTVPGANSFAIGTLTLNVE